MAKFKCKNCGRVFDKFCDTQEDSLNVQCPNCRSHWVVPNDAKFELVKQFYQDPIFPEPYFRTPSSLPKPPWRITCHVNGGKSF